MSGLQRLSPERAVEMYLEQKKDDATENTIKGQKARLKAFTQFCDEEGITDLRELDGRDLYEYRIWRSEGNGEGRDPVKTVTLQGQLSTLRVFLQFCGEIEAVDPELFDKTPVPELDAAADVSDSTLEPSRMATILEYLGRYEYASRDHVTFLLGWHTGARIGGLRALDLEDLDLEGDHQKLDGPAVHFVHRPKEGTPLKNKGKSTRWNRISEHIAQVVQDYIDGPRKEVEDEHGRRPLLTTYAGRPAGSTIRDTLYRWTRPCFVGEGCPHDRDPDECDATEKEFAATCPSSRSPHDMRSGRVTMYARESVPRDVVSDRLDASEQVLGKHYDKRTQRERAMQRSEYLPDL